MVNKDAIRTERIINCGKIMQEINHSMAKIEFVKKELENDLKNLENRIDYYEDDVVEEIDKVQDVIWLLEDTLEYIMDGRNTLRKARGNL